MFLRISIRYRKLIPGRGLHNMVRIGLLTSSPIALDSRCGRLLYIVRQIFLCLRDYAGFSSDLFKEVKPCLWELEDARLPF